jgi:hypothetical protein
VIKPGCLIGPNVVIGPGCVVEEGEHASHTKAAVPQLPQCCHSSCCEAAGLQSITAVSSTVSCTIALCIAALSQVFGSLDPRCCQESAPRATA